MPKKRTSIQPGQKLELDLSAAERKAILDDLVSLPPEYEAMLEKVDPERPLLLTLDELEDFSGYVAAESNHTTKKKLRAILDTAFEKMTDLLDTFTEAKPPAKKPTKPRRKRPSAQQSLAEWQRQTPEQAAFLATWAAAFLRLAEDRGTKHVRLEGFMPTDLDRLVLSNLPGVTPKVRRRLDSGKHELTAAETAGLLMAIAEQLCDAPSNQQLGMLMVAQSLMTVIQAGVAAVGPDTAPKRPLPKSRHSKPATNKPAKPIPRRPPAAGGRDNAKTGSPAVYQFRITLLDTSPLIWRRVQIEDCTLDTLHRYIQAVMEWTNSHLHHFWIGGKRYGRPSLNGCSVPKSHVIDSTQIRLSDILPANGKKTRFGYEYDFGDCWEHEIQFEGIIKPDPTTQYPVCVDGERAGPPDTCGGVSGYEYLLEVLADPNHEEYREMLEWAGRIDPEYFDATRATARMTKGLRR